jgi:hypothetical protein
MDKNIVLSLLAMMIANDLEQSNDTIDNLNNNLNTLDADKSGVVSVSLTISEIQFKFVKVLGEWGVMTAKGSWEPFRIVPMGAVEKMADAVQNVVNGKTE